MNNRTLITSHANVLVPSESYSSQCRPAISGNSCWAIGAISPPLPGSLYLVSVWLFPRPSLSIHLGNVSGIHPESSASKLGGLRTRWAIPVLKKWPRLFTFYYKNVIYVNTTIIFKQVHYSYMLPFNATCITKVLILSSDSFSSFCFQSFLLRKPRTKSEYIVM